MATQDTNHTESPAQNGDSASLPLPVTTECDLHTALCVTVRDNLRPLTLGLGVLYMLLLPGYVLLVPPPWTVALTALLAVSATGQLALYVVLRQHDLPLRWTYPLLTGLAGVVLVNTVLQHLAVKHGISANFVMLLVVAGFLFLSTRWLVVVITATGAGWAFTAWWLRPLISAQDFVLTLLSAVTVTLIVHTARIRTLRRLERLRYQAEQRKTELEITIEALQQSEERFRELSAAALEGIVIHDNGRILDANPIMATMLGYDHPAELIGKHALDMVEPESRAVIEEKLRYGDDLPYEAVGQRRDGSRLLVEVRGRAISYRGQPARVAAVRDITARKQAEEALRQSEDKFATAFRASPYPIIISAIDDGRYIDVNDSFTEVFGYTREEVIGRTSVELGVWPHPEARQQYLRIFQEQGWVRNFETTYRKKSGELGVVLISTDPIDLNGKRVLLSISQDITARKMAETEREQLIQELDAFARTVAHDLKAPLSLILGYAELLQIHSTTTSPEDRAEYLSIMEQGALKMSTIIDELLLLARMRQRDVEPELIDMGPIVQEACTRLADMITEYEAHLICPDTWPLVLGYGPWIEQIWINYLSNGLKYGGRPPRLELGATLQPDDMLRFWVCDNGPGLTREQQMQLFAPFTQLGRPGAAGYGLGLSIVRRIVEKLGGTVGVESEIGQGSVFSFTLRAAPTFPGDGA